MNTIEFLRLFQHQRYTLAHLSSKGMRSFPCVPQKLEKGIEFLTKQNEHADIYFMPNEGSGEFNESKTACHGTKQVINLSAIFLDAELADGSDPLPAVINFCNSYFYVPSAIIKTSPNRYHIYWILNPTELTKQAIVKWKQIQAFLHSKLSSDRTMTDLPQLMRLPGFQHKKKDFPIKALEVHGNPLNIDLDAAYDKLAAKFPELKSFKAHQPLESTTESYKVSEGERHEELLRRARLAYTFPSFSDQDVRCYIHGFIKNHVTNPVDFLPMGKRSEEVEKILSAAKTYHLESKKEEALKTVTAVISKKESHNSFELPDDFYYQAPNLVGEITRFIVDSSHYPIPSHAFAAACSIVGLCKARHIQGTRETPPLNYFLCLAPSGSGKTYVQSTVKNFLHAVEYSKYIQEGISSAQGLVTFLSNKQGLGLIMYDEVKELFQITQSKTAATYEARIASELTKLYTAYNSLYIPSTSKADKTQMIIKNPKLSFLGFGHQTLLDKLMTKDVILEGLIPRFLILNHSKRRDANPTQDKQRLPLHILDELRSYVTASNLVLDASLSNAATTSTELPSMEVKPLAPLSVPILDKFKTAIDSQYHSAVADNSGLEALFSRGLEQAVRIALTLSPNGQIDPGSLQFAITLVDNQTTSFYKTFDKTINTTKFAKNTDKLYDRILDLCSKEPYSITRKAAQNSTAKWYDTGDAFRKHLENLVERGLIDQYEVRKPSGQTEIRLKISVLTD